MSDADWVPKLAPQPGQSKFHALAIAIRQAVRAGELQPGERLPPVRDLALRLGVTPGTVARAYQIAARDGVLESTVGRGSFVRAVPLSTLQPMETEREIGPYGDGITDLRAAFMPDVGQIAAIRMAMRSALTGMGTEVLNYPYPGRDLWFRRAAMNWLGRFDAGPYGPDDLVLTMGGQAALMLALQLNLQNHRPEVLTEDLGYAGFRHAIRMARGRLVPLPMDSRGLDPGAVEYAAAAGRASVICVSPAAHNPTMVRMDADRRAAIVRVARNHDLQIVEDHVLAGPPRPWPDGTLRALAPERSWTITSMSKTFTPGLRGGVMICPGGTGPAARSGIQHTQFGIPFTHSAMIAALMQDGDAARFGRRVQAQFDERLRRTTAVLEGTDFNWLPEAPYVWLKLPPRWMVADFVAAAAARNVLVRGAGDFSPFGRGGDVADSLRPVPGGVRIAMSGQIDPDQMERAVRVLRELHDAPPA